MFDYDVVIIGAGPAGAVSAAKLNSDGFSVLIIEKMNFPRFVIGESLLPICMEYLEDTDLLQTIKNQNFQTKTGACFFNNGEICEFDFSYKFTDGWDYTYQVKRSDFDYALIEEVQRKGVEVSFNSSVIDVSCSKKKQTISYVNCNNKQIDVSCKFIIDASGYGRVLPRLFNLEKPVKSEKRGAIFSHISDYNKSKKDSNNIFIHAFNNNSAWVWSIPFSDNSASVGIVSNTDYIEKCAENNGELFKELIKSSPMLKERFIDSKFLFKEKTIYNYAASSSKLYGEGFVLCGNATEFLDPVFSSGVALAMASGHLAAKLIKKELNMGNVNWEIEYSEKMNAGINVFRSYVNAWYSGDLQKIFFSKEIKEEYKKQICSVLAGYVWDETNPFVKKHKKIIQTLSNVIEINERSINI